MSVSDIFSSNLAVSIISLLAGALITAVATKLHGRTAQVRYSTRTDRLALAADDPIFGSVRISWRNQEVRNLYMVSVEIENASDRDFESVEFKVYTTNDTFLLGERTSVVNTPYIVKWSDEFSAALAVAPGGTPTVNQWNTYNHGRDYRVPVFNRGQLLQHTYLCTRPADDVPPAIFLSMQLKGAKLKYQVRSNLVVGVPAQVAIPRGLVVAVLCVFVCGFSLGNVWAASGISMVVGLFAQLIGAAEYKGERWVRELIAG